MGVELRGITILLRKTRATADPAGANEACISIVVCCDIMDWSSTSLRVLRAIAETGSFTGAAGTLGFTQSAVSRQVASLEHATGAKLFDRRAKGAQLTPAGAMLLRHASTALDEVDRAAQVLRGADPEATSVRLGVFTSPGAALIPQTLALAAQRSPRLLITSREASTQALMRSLRAGTVDIAVIASKPPYAPPDDQRPALVLEVLLEGDLLVAVPASGDLGIDGTVSIAELLAATWIASHPSPSEPGMGVWPALPQRPRVAHQARDWLAKLTLVASGHGVTTLPPYLGLIPSGIRMARVIDGPPVTARVVAARLPGRPSAAISELSRCLHGVARSLPLA